MILPAKEFLKNILTAPSPSGFEESVQQLVRNYAESFADTVQTDIHGNVIAARNPDAPLRVMLAGHCDQIGLIINYIDEQGYLYPLTIGGWDIQNLVGVRVKIWSSKDSTKEAEESVSSRIVRTPVDGVIGKKPIHLMDDEDRRKVPKIKDLWIDIGAKDKEDAEKIVSVGDPVTVELEYRELLNNLIAAPATDDKVGLWTAMEALRRIDAAKLNVGVFAVSTVQEEVGLRGSRTSTFGIDPQIGIATDVTFATDCPTVEKKQNGDVKLGGGPVLSKGPNLTVRLVKALEDVAKANDIPVQVIAEGKITGTDAGSIQVNRSGVATALISIPNRYMHTPVEMISLNDIDYAADLMARYCESITPDVSYIPG
ncbi:MAG: M42 family metallopeptidase [Planctomycetaceae bacterium]|jgi:endoglucanase|nr:M42 family metallopeptidase [Planctomycetaceae bacterium]